MALNCLIVSTNMVDSPYPVYPLGAAHIAGALEGAGFGARHFDLMEHSGAGDAEGELKALLEDNDFGLIALSIRNLDTTDSAVPESFIHQAAEVMALIRQTSKAPVVIGGPAFSLLPEKIFTLMAADYGIVGEGEELIVELAEEIAAGRPPTPGIIGPRRALNPWRPVHYQQETADFYTRHGGMLNIQSKRGCPNACAYCSYPTLEGRRLRPRDPEEVAEEFIRLHRDLKASYIFFADAVFNDHQGHFRQVCEALIRRRNRTPWCAFFRPAGLGADDLELMKEAGLAAMELGTDAACDTTLAGLNKGFTFEEVLKVNEAILTAKIPAAHFIIFGGPGETGATLEEGITNIERLGRTVVFAFIGLRVLPDTAIHARAQREGEIGDDLLEPAFYYSPSITRAEIDSTLKAAWRGRFDRIYPWSAMEARIKRLHSKGYHGPMWDFLVKTR